MLQEKVETLRKKVGPLIQAYKAIEIASPIKAKIKEACYQLKEIIDSGELDAVDEEIKAAIITVYKIFESMRKELDDPSIAPLFDNPGKY